MIVTRLVISNFRGVSAIDLHPGPGGVVIAGPNMQGKTSVLRALQAALASQDIGPDAIRIGEASAEIIVDLDAVYRVRRRITKSGSNSLKVSSQDGSVDFKRPQSLLDDLLGPGIDPLALYLAKPEEQRQIIMRAMPMRVTAEQVARWLPDVDPTALAGLDLENTPGLEVIEILRSSHYTRRTAANKEAKEATAKADRSGAGLPPIPEALTADEAQAAFDEADRALERLQIQDVRAEGARAAMQGSQKRAGERRAKAEAIMAGLPATITEEQQTDLATRWDAANKEIGELRLKLRDAEDRAKACHAEVKEFDRVMKARADGEAEAQRLNAEAAELEAEVADVNAVPPEVLAAAKERYEAAKAARKLASDAALIRAQHEVATRDRAAADAAAAHAKKLDEAVNVLTHAAPAELAQAGDGIPGLTFEDGKVALDGVSIDKRSGAEQLDLAIAIAKRAAGKARILVVDGLERVDAEGRQRLIRKINEDGFQLWASRVADGKVEIEVLAPDAGERSAAE